MASALLDEIQEVIGYDGPDLAERIESVDISDETLEAIEARWAQRRSLMETPEYDDGYNPYISDPLRSRALAVPGTHFLFDFNTQAETNDDLRALSKHLLYANSVALSDPIPQIFDKRYSDAGKPLAELLAYRRTRLANLVRFLQQVDPLLEDDVLVFIDAPRYQINYKADDLRALARRPEVRAATAALNPANKEFAARAAEQMLDQQPGTMPFGPEAYAMHALNAVLAELATGTVEHGGWDIYLPHAAMQSALEYVVKRAWDAPVKSRGSNRHEPRLMRDLLNVELPDLTAQVTVRDLVDIRSNDEAFSTWRRELRGALRALDDELADHGDLSADAARKTLADELDPAMQKVRKQVGRSRFLSTIGGGGVDFSIGAVVETLFHGAQGLPGAVPTLTATVCAALVYEWLKGGKTAAGKRALARHYAVFGAASK
jgi:hypothetical protein